VKQGDVVHQGDVIGEVGMTGNATGPHLHFEIRHDRVFIDPMPYLTGQRPD
jgi:murein DD-endopeptidase MepM/ murein hydrolase activator NlpD